MAQVSLVGYAVGGAFLNKAFFDLYYYILAIIAAGAAVAAKTLAERAGTAPSSASPHGAIQSPGFAEDRDRRFG
jgi:CO/xanthine dehydrogenase Mo-binding subunit